jgi:hypothetical protein
MDEPPEQPADPRLEQVIRQTRIAVGASDRMPVRVMVLFIASVVCAALAPLPFSLVGVSALALLALDTAIHRR